MPYWLEFAYLLTGGPVLCLLALLGLGALWLGKRDLDTSRRAIELAEREMRQRLDSERTRLAVDMCLRFAEHVLPLIDEANDAVLRSPLPQPRRQASPWSRDSYDEMWNAGWFGRTKVKKVLRALNAMEAIAVAFVHEAADVTVARQSIGFAFVQAASRYSFVIASVKSVMHETAFPATRQVCDLWCDLAWEEVGEAPAEDLLQ